MSIATGSTPLQKYYELLTKIEQGVNNKDDIYNDLLKTEENVLSTVSRVAESKMKDDMRGTAFLDQNMASLLRMTANTWLKMIRELVTVNDWQDLYAIMLSRDRKIYLGIFLALVGMFIFFIDVSS